MDVLPEALAKSRRTISAYEDYAERYDAIVRHVPNPREQASLRRLGAIAGTGGQILEVGSGPGYDADFLETLGVKVRRTDATKRFLELRAARGTVSFSISSPMTSAVPTTPSWPCVS